MFKAQYFDNKENRITETGTAAGTAAGTTTGTTTVTVTTVNHTEPGVSFNELPKEVIEREIAQAYQAVIGAEMNSIVMNFMREMMDKGMEPGVIKLAIDATGWARRPSPAYLRKVLQNCMDTGCTTVRRWLYREHLRGKY